MPPSLPERPSLEWLRKTAKGRLQSLRAHQPDARLADAQLALAREYGFESWRKLRAHVDQIGSRREPSAMQVTLTDDVVGRFLQLVGTGRLNETRQVLAAIPSLVNAVGPHPFWGGRPQALHVAIETTRRDMIALILDAGADVNGNNDSYDHWSPLMLAINRDLSDVQAELIRRGAAITLLEALLLGDDARVDALLDRDGLPAIAPNGGSILSFARTTSAIDRLIALGARTDVQDRWGATPAEAFSRLGSRGEPLLRHLLKRGIHARPEEFARLDDRETLARMIAADPEIARQDAVLMAAVDFRHHDLVRWLLAHGASPHARSSAQSRQTALHSAAWNGDLEMVKLLLEAGADPNARDEQYDGVPRGWALTAIEVENNAACQAVVDYLEPLTTDQDG